MTLTQNIEADLRKSELEIRWNRGKQGKIFDVYSCLEWVGLPALLHAFIYVNNKMTNTGLRFDVCVRALEVSFFGVYPGFLRIRKADIWSIGWAKVKVASLNMYQYIIWFMTMTIQSISGFDFDFSLTQAFINQEIWNCFKWTAKATTCALAAQLAPI